MGRGIHPDLGNEYLARSFNQLLKTNVSPTSPLTYQCGSLTCWSFVFCFWFVCLFFHFVLFVFLCFFFFLHDYFFLHLSIASFTTWPDVCYSERLFFRIQLNKQIRIKAIRLHTPHSRVHVNSHNNPIYHSDRIGLSPPPVSLFTLNFSPLVLFFFFLSPAPDIRVALSHQELDSSR